MAIPGAGPQPQPTKKALAAQKKAASLSLNKKGQDPAATVVEIPKNKVSFAVLRSREYCC